MYEANLDSERAQSLLQYTTSTIKENLEKMKFEKTDDSYR